MIVSATDHCEEEEKLIECRDHQDAAHCYLTLVFMVEPSAKCRTVTWPSSSMATILDEYLMVPLGSSFSSVCSRKSRFTERISCGPLT